jgi:hypothetical protein
LEWSAASTSKGDDGETLQPLGFYCHRYVLASSIRIAQESAFRRVRDNLERQTGWLTAKVATLELEADEITPVSMYRILKPDNRGHIFYNQE